jgi:hypothetical protein
MDNPLACCIFLNDRICIVCIWFKGHYVDAFDEALIEVEKDLNRKLDVD